MSSTNVQLPEVSFAFMQGIAVSILEKCQELGLRPTNDEGRPIEIAKVGDEVRILAGGVQQMNIHAVCKIINDAVHAIDQHDGEVENQKPVL
jgi:hypothetical protein